MWRPQEVGEVFAERAFAFIKRGKKRTVRFVVGRPVKGPDPRDPWWCPTELGAPFDTFRALPGEDSLQSVVLALQFIDETLPTSARELGGRVEWLGEHERVVFPGTQSNVQRWEAVSRLTAGLVDAVEHLEARRSLPRPTAQPLRGLVASHGASDDARVVKRARRRKP